MFHMFQYPLCAKHIQVQVEETIQKGEDFPEVTQLRLVDLPQSGLLVPRPTSSHTPWPLGHRPAGHWASLARGLLHHVQPLLGAVELACTTLTNPLSPATLVDQLNTDTCTRDCSPCPK